MNNNIPDDTSVVTSSYVTQDKLPILRVSHQDDEEGGDIWQFHCGNGDYDMSKMQLVRLSTILSIDSSVSTVLDIPIGYCAVRKSQSAEWEISEEIN